MSKISTSRLPLPPPPQWAIDMNSPVRSRPAKSATIVDPPGYSAPKPASKPTSKQQRSQQSTSTAPARTSSETEALKLKKAWEVALAPSKQIPMNAIMMYMSGNSLQIFSIMMVFMLFKGPIQGIISTNLAFAKFESEGTRGKMIGVKLVYVLMQFALLAMGIYKVNAMGLLPYESPNLEASLTFSSKVTDFFHFSLSRTTRSDWLAWEPERLSLEQAYFAFQ
ncbi:ER membrane protein complex subunit 4 [Myotisia sp. PD_48]|nr:ER membrane protein complex subunit 4 [Myotisia sp. PD_48]